MNGMVKLRKFKAFNAEYAQQEFLGLNLSKQPKAPQKEKKEKKMDNNWKPVSSCSTSAIFDPNEIELEVARLAVSAGFNPDENVSHKIEDGIFTVYVSPELYEALEKM